MGNFISQLIGAGRGDENPAADAAYRAADARKAASNKEAARARVERLAAEATGSGNGGNQPGNGITGSV